MTTSCPASINTEILNFITANNVATVCGAENNKPYCFNCFYAVLEDEACIIFKSSENTRHMEILSANNNVAGTITSSSGTSLSRVEGVQFEGIMTGKATAGLKAAKSYYLRYPFAITVPGHIWVLELHSLKYTRTVSGIKHKASWQREPQTV